MLAIDTNIIVRFLTGDDREQAEKCRQLIAGEAIFVATSVLLESEWVLRSAYGFSAPQIVRALRAFAGLPTVTLEDESLAARALNWTDQGMDFADALHLGCAQGCTVFVSLDRALAKAAAALSDVQVRYP